VLRILLVAIVILITGCTTKQDGILSMLSIDNAHEKALGQTQSAQIINSLELRAKITATYLNPLYPDKYKDNEWFFVGVYVPHDSGKAKPNDINRTDYKLMLKVGDQNLSAINAQVVDKKSAFFKQMPHTDNWSRYYIIEFPKSSPKIYNMTLMLISEEYGTAKMDFVK
jgi:hypothetical protein